MCSIDPIIVVPDTNLRASENYEEQDPELNNKLNELISTFDYPKINIFQTILRYRMYLSLLYKEAEWISTHHYGVCRDDDHECQSGYSGDTECEHRCGLIDLVLGLFGYKEEPNRCNEPPINRLEQTILLKMLTNMTHLLLLKKEADWLSKHSYDPENEEGKIFYDGQTEGIHKIHLQNLVLGLFGFTFHPKAYSYVDALNY